MLQRISIRIFLTFALALLVQGQSRAISSNDSLSVGPLLTHYQGIDYQGSPWVKRTSRPYALARGLDGRHVSVWASHGRYYDNSKAAWQWQRPFLFCTTEDMLTQSFVYPYLMPMLERAGAVVFTPRERDYQTQEAIVDNDTPGRYGTYAEHGKWTDAGKGFSLNFAVLNDTVQPFTLGTSRCVKAGSDGKVMWMPQIPETGRYAVYVSYPDLPHNVPDAHYTVYHAGRATRFSVNQQMGGGTWVYLGTFLFEAGQSDRNRVVLSAESELAGQGDFVVSADAVRFGGGRSIVERSNPSVSQTIAERHYEVMHEMMLCDSIAYDTIYHYAYGNGSRSGMPRYLEAARYYTQWAGLPDTLYTRDHGQMDYNDDLRSRSYLLNLLGGGSCYMPDTVGRRVPFELQMALHTDAGYHRNGSIYGSLTIATDYDDYHHPTYRTGLSRKVSERYADRMLAGVAHDLSALYGVTWPQRELRVSNYSETRSPQVPSTILELLAHQNFTDMTYAHDPNFKFAAARAIYKVMLREIYQLHDLGEPTIQPLPVRNVSATLAPDHATAYVTWQPQIDPLESTADATNYMLYIRQGDNDWDDGTLLSGQCNAVVNVKPGVHYQFRIAALNPGGESFPSEPVSVYVAAASTQGKHPAASPNAPTVLLVNAFDRLSGPARINTTDSIGFLLHRDVGVSYGVNTSLCGAQTVFSPSAMGRNGAASLGYCGSELTGTALAGNHFDGIELHASDILAATTDVNIVSMSRSAFDQLEPAALSQYALIDYIAGLQADVPYNLVHYDVFTPATQQRLADYAAAGGRIFASGSRLGQADSLFLARTFHSIRRATIGHYDRGTLSGLGIDIPIFNRPNSVHYPCQESDVLEASDGVAFPAFAYGPRQSATGEAGYSAGVAWQNGVVMGFPYDCIADLATRRTVMDAVLRHFGIVRKQ